MHVKRTDEDVERSMVINHIFVNVPKTFGECCMSIVPQSKYFSNLSVEAIFYEG